MALPGAGGMSLPDGSMGRVLLGGIGFLPLCSPDLICLLLVGGLLTEFLVGLLCVGAEGVSFSSVTWTSLLQNVDLFLGVVFPVIMFCLLGMPGSG